MTAKPVGARRIMYPIIDVSSLKVLIAKAPEHIFDSYYSNPARLIQRDPKWSNSTPGREPQCPSRVDRSSL